MSALHTSFLTLGLLISGISIPLILSFQDNQKIYLDKEEDEYYFFSQPLLQTSMIFLGEIICILIIHIVNRASSSLDHSMREPIHSSNNNYSDYNEWVTPRTSAWSWSAIWFVLPSACDLIATTLLNLGLIYTTPSIYQMMRSSIIGFSAIFSCLFLSRKFLRKEWVSIAFIMLGAGVIVASCIWHKEEAHYLGPLLLVAAQLFIAGQFILEEYLMDRYHLDPVRAMGIEGIFGTILLSGALIVAAFVGQNQFDVAQGIQDMIHIPALWQSSIVLAFMVAIFNFFGLTVSTSIGVPSRSILDTIRTILTWVIAIHYSWDSFSWLELVGFVVLVVGVFIFNGVFSNLKSNVMGETTPLLS